MFLVKDEQMLRLTSDSYYGMLHQWNFFACVFFRAVIVDSKIISQAFRLVSII